MSARRQTTRGMTLIELVVSIVVISLAGAALAGTLGYLAGTGSTSLLQAQAQSIATAYLNEISATAFTDPNVDGEGSRDLFDDIDDYDGLDTPQASDVQGNVAANFQVSVRVGPGVLGALPAADVRRIDVTVTYGDGASVVATGYRTRRP
jgi:MSHA pilin protein MshD